MHYSQLWINSCHSESHMRTSYCIHIENWP